MTPLDYLARVLLAYLLLQAAILIAVKFFPSVRLTGQVQRAVWVNIVNHLFYVAAAVIGIALAPEAAKITPAGAIWAVPVGIVAGFFYFVAVEVAARLGRKAMGQILFDLQEMAVSPVFPKYIFVPGLFNMVLLKPLAEELLFRGMIIGVLSTQIHWGAAMLIAVVVENLRYPQLVWFARNTIRSLVPALVFLLSPTILLTLALGVMAHALAATAQISRVRKLAENVGKENPGLDIVEVIAGRAPGKDSRENGRPDDSDT